MVTHDPKAARRAKRLLHLEKGTFVHADIDALEARAMKFLPLIIAQRDAQQDSLAVHRRVDRSEPVPCGHAILAADPPGRNYRQTAVHHRVAVLNEAGLAGRVPIVYVDRIRKIPGVVAATPFSWFGGKYRDERATFAQFGVDPQSIFDVYEEYDVACRPAQGMAARQDRLRGRVDSGQEYGLEDRR